MSTQTNSVLAGNRADGFTRNEHKVEELARSLVSAVKGESLSMGHALDLTTALRAEIERAQVFEAAHQIAARLGLPAHVVKAEVRRIRKGVQGEPRRRARFGTFAGVALPVTALALGLAVWRAKGSLPTPTPSTFANAASKPTERTQELYARLEAGAGIDARELEESLASADVEVRLAAVRLSTRRPIAGGDPSPIAHLVDDPEPRVRMATLQALEALGDPRGVPYLSKALSNSSRALPERLLALNALATIHNDDSTAALLAVLVDRVLPLRQRAFAALSTRFKTDLGVTTEQLARDPEGVQRRFRDYTKGRPA